MKRILAIAIAVIMTAGSIPSVYAVSKEGHQQNQQDVKPDIDGKGGFSGHLLTDPEQAELVAHVDAESKTLTEYQLELVDGVNKVLQMMAEQQVLLDNLIAAGKTRDEAKKILEKLDHKIVMTFKNIPEIFKNEDGFNYAKGKTWINGAKNQGMLSSAESILKVVHEYLEDVLNDAGINDVDVKKDIHKRASLFSAAVVDAYCTESRPNDKGKTIKLQDIGVTAIETDDEEALASANNLGFQNTVYFEKGSPVPENAHTVICLDGSEDAIKQSGFKGRIITQSDLPRGAANDLGFYALSINTMLRLLADQGKLSSLDKLNFSAAIQQSIDLLGLKSLDKSRPATIDEVLKYQFIITFVPGAAEYDVNFVKKFNDMMVAWSKM